MYKNIVSAREGILVSHLFRPYAYLVPAFELSVCSMVYSFLESYNHVCVLFVYYFNLHVCRQSNLASLIHNKVLNSTFSNFSIALRVFMRLMISNCSGECRHGEEQIAMTDESW